MMIRVVAEHSIWFCTACCRICWKISRRAGTTWTDESHCCGAAILSGWEE